MAEKPPPDDIAGRLESLGAKVRQARADALERERPSEPPHRRRRLVIAGGVTGALAVGGLTAGLALADPGADSGTAASTTVPATTVPATTAPPTTAPASTVPSTTVSPTTQPATTRPAANAPATTGPAQSPAAGTYVVRPGDSLWSIARSVQTARSGGAPASAQVARYWIQLVTANLDRLPVPGDTNLIFPGQTLQLPA